MHHRAIDGEGSTRGTDKINHSLTSIQYIVSQAASAMFTPEYTLMLLIFTKLSSQCASKEFVLLVLVRLSPDLDSSIQKCVLYRHGNAQV